jgi:hypothetical protein
MHKTGCRSKTKSSCEDVIIVSNQNVEQSVIYVKVLTNTKIQTGSKHLKLPVTDDFAGVVKIPKLFKRDLPAKGDQIWYFHFCGVILDVIIVSNQNVEQSVIYVKVLTNTKIQTFVLNKYNFEWPRSVFRMPTDFIISLLLLSDLDEPLGKISNQ